MERGRPNGNIFRHVARRDIRGHTLSSASAFSPSTSSKPFLTGFPAFESNRAQRTTPVSGSEEFRRSQQAWSQEGSTPGPFRSRRNNLRRHRKQINELYVENESLKRENSSLRQRLASHAAQLVELRGRLDEKERAYNGLLSSIQPPGPSTHGVPRLCDCEIPNEDTWEETIAALDRQLESM